MRTLALLAAVCLIPLAAPMAACSTVREAVNGPDLTPVRYPSALVPQDQQILTDARQPPPEAGGANSLWRVGARAFFNDQRAHRIGDILTVNIAIDDSAQTQNQTTAGRTTTNSAGMPHFLGLESSLGRFLPGGFDPAHAIETSTATNNAGSGQIRRAEQIRLTIAAVVTAVLPNGNMVIQGTQEVRTNGELRQLTVSGIVRPEDISSSNTILHTQIAEARISYGGRGDISALQRTPAGTAILQRINPF
jgi:flagellar L-ring protein precursor FlgH